MIGSQAAVDDEGSLAALHARASINSQMEVVKDSLLLLAVQFCLCVHVQLAVCALYSAHMCVAGPVHEIRWNSWGPQ